MKLALLTPPRRRPTPLSKLQRNSHRLSQQRTTTKPPANTMNVKGLFVLALVTLLGAASGESAAQEANPAVARELQTINFATRLAHAINTKRADKGLKAVCINKKLMQAAKAHANDMAKNNYVSPTGSDGSTPTSRYAAQLIATKTSAELVAAGQSTVDPVSRRGLFAVAAMAFASMVSAEADDHVARELQVADFSAQLLKAVNAKRSEKGLAAVCINTKLAAAAQDLAEDNAENNRISTKSSDGSTPTTRYETAGIETSQSAELVAAGQASVNAVIATWTKSSSTYLYSDFKFIGPGYAYDKSKQYKHYWVLDFANADGESCA
ncbi:unnamed protein product [Phytophthora fragariaefolia]|uniref:Unnamed protein product n=1 Tax=Phytophthora fragariaefolia TaxID=1490495 RepID=A0A9W6U0E1_9STRA|nr:unnamed protein product [Phytophthora fragariaefolia]